MATTPTNKPIPSEDPRDLKFNAGKIDEVVTSDAHYYTDRFGKRRWTIAGFQYTAEEAIRNYGYITMDSFEDGAILTLSNQTLRYEANGEYYRWDGEFPKIVPAGSTPDSTGEVKLGAWVSVGDASLLARLKSNSAGDGASLVTFESGNSVESLSDNDGAKNIGSGERSLLARNNDIKHSGDFSTLQAAVDASLPKNDLLISPGEYTEKVTIGNAQLKGVGGVTVLKTPADFTNTVQVNLSTPHWQFRHSSGFAIDGSGTTGSAGISFDPSDQYSGRHNFSDLYIHNINKAIQRPSGNIGNTWRNIGVSTCDWGYYAISGSEMHCGADTLYNIHFDGISTYAVYLNGTVDNGGVGAWWLKDSIIEASGGGGIYLKSKSGDCPTSPCGVSNIWMEAVATSSAVNVDGVAQKPRVLKLVDTAIFFAEYSYLNNIELSNSNLVTYGCRFDNADGNQDIVIDEQSTIVAHDVYLNGSSGKDVIVESVASQSATIAATNLSLRGNLTRGRVFNTPTGNKLMSITFDSGSHEFSGSATVSGSTASDGLHAATCTEFSFPGAGLFEMVASRTTITSGRWYVWGVNSRLQSGTADVSITSGITMGSVYTKTGEWISTFGVGKASATGTVALYVSTGGSSGATVRFSDFFIAEFTTQAQAMSFANSRMSLS
ncbi:TPA: hypothetical protein JLY95_004475 [Escherichia coli]|nr:hypothetical protein [Escherichia coli]